MPNDPLRAWLTKIGWGMALAVALSVALAVSTGGTIALTLLCLAGFGALGFIAKVVLALARRRPPGERLSDWDEAVALAALSAGAHLASLHLVGAI